jgi:hypothetical protein
MIIARFIHILSVFLFCLFSGFVKDVGPAHQGSGSLLLCVERASSFCCLLLGGCSLRRGG